MPGSRWIQLLKNYGSHCAVVFDEAAPQHHANLWDHIVGGIPGMSHPLLRPAARRKSTALQTPQGPR